MAAAAPAKHTIAVDLDEVLGGFLPALTAWHNRVHGTCFAIDDYRSYAYCDLWGGSNAETVRKVHAFFDSEEFATGVRPIAKAAEVLRSFLGRCRFFVVTSRQHVIAEQTAAWIAEHFEGVFAGVKMGNHYDLASPDPDEVTNDVVKRSKPQMCADIGACVLIDDSAKYACQCATDCGGAFFTVLYGTYGWNTGGQVPQIADGSLQRFVDAGKVVRVGSWEGTAMSEALTRHLDRLDARR
jgi:hypothetical protein